MQEGLRIAPLSWVPCSETASHSIECKLAGAGLGSEYWYSQHVWYDSQVVSAPTQHRQRAGIQLLWWWRPEVLLPPQLCKVVLFEWQYD
jgi:hypothetical protein